MTRPIHCLFDIETIGASDYAPIVQIGAVLFSPWGKPSDFGAPEAVDMENGEGVISAPGTEFRIDVGVNDGDLCRANWTTLQWWLTETSPEARRRVFGEKLRHPLVNALRAFTEWCTGWGQEPTYWWSDMDFDLRLMRQAYSCFSSGPERVRNPLGTDCGPHRGVRDYRTLRWVGKALGIEQAPRVGVEHDALDDAYHQAYYTVKVLRALGVER